MKEIFVMYAKYNQAGNKTIYDILDGFSSEDREKDRGSYYKSLSGLLRHIFGGTCFFLGMFKAVVAQNAAALKALAALDGVTRAGDAAMSEGEWKAFKGSLETADAAFVNFAEALSDADLDLPLKIEWYGGNPPLSFMLHQLVVHNTHHRGQMSQIFDSLKIDNDYSGISAAFLPR
ncbi:MAG: DUF664 domain-containing protein [Treponema sp.]|nr:DUF664 domain-containing protein [Treponema sp.]